MSHYLNGSNRDDNILGTVDNDVINGRAGNDVISGLAGNDILNGGDGADTISGNEGNDILIGGRGDDFLSGDAGIDDVLSGDAGNDIYFPGFGNDIMRDPFGGADIFVIEAPLNQKKDVNFGSDNILAFDHDDTIIFVGYSRESVIITNDPFEDVFGTPDPFTHFQFADGSFLSVENVQDNGFNLVEKQDYFFVV
jgi:Ca2+-binding RTX toxin-like protein